MVLMCWDWGVTMRLFVGGTWSSTSALRCDESSPSSLMTSSLCLSWSSSPSYPFLRLNQERKFFILWLKVPLVSAYNGEGCSLLGEDELELHWSSSFWIFHFPWGLSKTKESGSIPWAWKASRSLHICLLILKLMATWKNWSKSHSRVFPKVFK